MNDRLRKPCAMFQYKCQRYHRHQTLSDNLPLLRFIFLTCFIFTGSQRSFVAIAHSTSTEHTLLNSDLNQGAVVNSSTEASTLTRSAEPLSELHSQSPVNRGLPEDFNFSVDNPALLLNTNIRIADFVNINNDTGQLHDSPDRANRRPRTIQGRLSVVNPDRARNFNEKSRFRPYEQPNGLPYLSSANSPGHHFLDLINNKASKKHGFIRRYPKVSGNRNGGPSNNTGDSNECLSAECHLVKEKKMKVREKKDNRGAPLVIISSSYGDQTRARTLEDSDRLKEFYMGVQLTERKPPKSYSPNEYSDQTQDYYSATHGYSSRGYSGDRRFKVLPGILHYEATLPDSVAFESVSVDNGNDAFGTISSELRSSEVQSNSDEMLLNTTTSATSSEISAQQKTVQPDSSTEIRCINPEVYNYSRNITGNQFSPILCNDTETTTAELSSFVKVSEYCIYCL